ncbi:hypothetical protein [Photorhabdus bodei]|uniref:Uncharacterized protein n=1 Tax=Photorhabdus bodei TaxID=2029681 RepID=A0AAW6BR76_9GAMM|nr:hypothetical protein [Photorhabdus bodei]MDB6375311.1 hypothetical protein [Photorhabdus bodei]
MTLYYYLSEQLYKALTKPREEMEAVANLDAVKNSNLRRLCKMARA